jgi:hypothetical protein
MRTPQAIASALLLIAPGLAKAEVSDKIATIPELWITAALAGLLLFVVSRVWVRVGLILLPGTAFLGYAALEPVLDPYIRPAISAEQGEVYFAVAYTAVGLMVAAHILGLLLGHRRYGAAA